MDVSPRTSTQKHGAANTAANPARSMAAPPRRKHGGCAGNTAHVASDVNEQATAIERERQREIKIERNREKQRNGYAPVRTRLLTRDAYTTRMCLPYPTTLNWEQKQRPSPIKPLVLQNFNERISMERFTWTKRSHCTTHSVPKKAVPKTCRSRR